MGYYDQEETVEEYIKMAEGYDGRELIEILRLYLSGGSTVLELGMGPGVDLDLLAEHYTVTGSDLSTAFLDRYRRTHPDADLVQLDAVTLEIDRTFDCIYSNKVLHHLTADKLKESLRRQMAKLNEGGLLSHSFWAGDETEVYSGMRFTQWSEKSLTEIIDEKHEIVRLERYAEMEDDDSVYLLLRK